jgi:predicted transcriptional regulator
MACRTVQAVTPVATLTIRIDIKIDRQLARLAKLTGRTKSDLAREAIRRQLTIHEFRDLRRQAMPHAAAAGYLTDEDVFRNIS